MARCSRCRQRKAKRQCPALGSDLCPLCCGRLREKELHCPPGCPFLTQHKPYQENKIIQKKRTFSEDVLQDERLNWLILNIEAPLREYAGQNPAFTDKDAVLALEYAKDKVEKNRSRLLLSRDEGRVRNEVGEAILVILEQCRFQRKIIMLQDVERYTTEEKLKCLENVILGIKYLAHGRLAGRTYLQDLARRLDRLKEFSEQKKILTRT
ncbi:MAG: hypothetical protein A2V45_13230 [Candidatus Aminicenantes bacterium RBG_19FT_COMBO_58_17]|jgi:hypothetical protein|nr:MAG: hypothetical protein A2V45_13230 [Candidatus Aminicenantes bacterium RBG_19FT_COMBO_58_17]